MITNADLLDLIDDPAAREKFKNIDFLADVKKYLNEKYYIRISEMDGIEKKLLFTSGVFTPTRQILNSLKVSQKKFSSYMKSKNIYSCRATVNGSRLRGWPGVALLTGGQEP